MKNYEDLDLPTLPDPWTWERGAVRGDPIALKGFDDGYCRIYVDAEATVVIEGSSGPIPIAVFDAVHKVLRQWNEDGDTKPDPPQPEPQWEARLWIHRKPVPDGKGAIAQVWVDGETCRWSIGITSKENLAADTTLATGSVEGTSERCISEAQFLASQALGHMLAIHAIGQGGQAIPVEWGAFGRPVVVCPPSS